MAKTLVPLGRVVSKILLWFILRFKLWVLEAGSKVHKMTLSIAQAYLQYPTTRLQSWEPKKRYYHQGVKNYDRSNLNRKSRQVCIALWGQSGRPGFQQQSCCVGIPKLWVTRTILIGQLALASMFTTAKSSLATSLGNKHISKYYREIVFFRNTIHHSWLKKDH